MIIRGKLLQILSDIESYHIKKTELTTNMDKFYKAICAFSK